MISMYVILIRSIYDNAIYYRDYVKKYKELPKSSSCMKQGTIPPGHRVVASRRPFFHEELSGCIIISPSCKPLNSQTFCRLFGLQDFTLLAAREERERDNNRF